MSKLLLTFVLKSFKINCLFEYGFGKSTESPKPEIVQSLFEAMDDSDFSSNSFHIFEQNRSR